MNQHTNSSFAPRFAAANDNYLSDRSSSKKEKFLFDDSEQNPRISNHKKPQVSYRTTQVRTQENFVMRITVEANCVTELRHLVLSTCGELVQYMKVTPVDHATKMKIWICMNKASIDAIISKIIGALPQAEIGRITPLSAT